MKLPSPPVLNVSLQLSGPNEVAVGRLAMHGRRVIFEYDPTFVQQSGFEISPAYLRRDFGVREERTGVFGGLYGVFADSLPDSWGRLLVDRRARSLGLDPAALTPLDRLACVGTTGLGALTYRPGFPVEVTESAVDIGALAAEAQRVIVGDPGDVLAALLQLGSSPGGARPKILVARRPDGSFAHGISDPEPDHVPLIVKFPGPGDPRDIGPIEHAYAAMARAAGLRMTDCGLIEDPTGPGWFVTERFDRHAGQRLHLHSLAGLLHADPWIPSLDYEALLRATQFLTRDVRDVYAALRMAAFNVFAYNRDDHARQFSFLMDGSGEWHLSPAYDLTFATGPGGEHSTSVVGEGRAPGRTHLLKLAARAGLDAEPSKKIIDEVAEATQGWTTFADAAGVSRASRDRITSYQRQVPR